jgi:hypothetical protein
MSNGGRIIELQEEIERLRAVLLKIEVAAIYAPAHHIADMARAALDESSLTAQSVHGQNTSLGKSI